MIRSETGLFYFYIGVLLLVVMFITAMADSIYRFFHDFLRKQLRSENWQHPT